MLGWRRAPSDRSDADAQPDRPLGRNVFSLVASILLHALLLLFFTTQTIVAIDASRQATSQSLSFIVSRLTRLTRETPLPAPRPTAVARVATPVPARLPQPSQPRAARAAPHRAELAKQAPTAKPQQPRVALLAPVAKASEEPHPQPSAPPTAPPATSAPLTIATAIPTLRPTVAPTIPPTAAPTLMPTAAPTILPTAPPTIRPTAPPTAAPTAAPTAPPTAAPTAAPTARPTAAPTLRPTAAPTLAPTALPSAAPTRAPAAPATIVPTSAPSARAVARPIASPAPAATAVATGRPAPTATPGTAARGTPGPGAQGKPSAAPASPGPGLAPATPAPPPVPRATAAPPARATPSPVPGDALDKLNARLQGLLSKNGVAYSKGQRIGNLDIDVAAEIVKKVAPPPFFMHRAVALTYRRRSASQADAVLYVTGRKHVLIDICTGWMIELHPLGGGPPSGYAYVGPCPADVEAPAWAHSMPTLPPRPAPSKAP